MTTATTTRRTDAIAKRRVESSNGGIARQGNPVVGGGVVTSGTMSPSLEIGIGMAYVPAAMAAEGTEIQIDVRGKQRAATVAKKPLYKK